MPAIAEVIESIARLSSASLAPIEDDFCRRTSRVRAGRRRPQNAAACSRIPHERLWTSPCGSITSQSGYAQRRRKYSSNLTPSTPGLRQITLAARRGAPGPSCNSNRCGTLSTPAALNSAKVADELWMVHCSSRDPFAKLITPT